MVCVFVICSTTSFLSVARTQLHVGNQNESEVLHPADVQQMYFSFFSEIRVIENQNTNDLSRPFFCRRFLFFLTQYISPFQSLSQTNLVMRCLDTEKNLDQFPGAIHTHKMKQSSWQLSLRTFLLDACLSPTLAQVVWSRWRKHIRFRNFFISVFYSSEIKFFSWPN